jgi:Cu2+-containing amine oxidase
LRANIVSYGGPESSFFVANLDDSGEQECGFLIATLDSSGGHGDNFSVTLSIFEDTESFSCVPNSTFLDDNIAVS